MIVDTITIFLIACVTSLLLTVSMREMARRIGLTDQPDGHRKLHRIAMPLGGGVAVFLATAGVVAGLMVFHSTFYDPLWNAWQNPVALFVAGVVIVVVGLIDDRVGLSGRQKLLGQVLAASVLMASGLIIRKVSIFGLPIDLGYFGILFTLFWLLGAVNALNLLDGIDGLATTVGIILVSTIAAMAVRVGRYEVAIVGVVFAGSLVGFIRFNFPPASIFLGDTGSMLIGLVVGAMAIQGSLKGPGTVLLAAPLAIWAIPIFDSAAAIIRRKLTGRSIYSTDRGHLHHRLLELLGSNKRVLALVATCCALTSFSALLSVFLVNDLIALLACSAVLVIFIVSGVFGRAEVLLLGSRIRRMGRSLVGPMSVGNPRGRATTIQLQGSQQWNELWDDFAAEACQLSLSSMRLDLNLPIVHEGFHGFWERPAPSKAGCSWRVELPLLHNGNSVGRLVVVGDVEGDGVCLDVQRLMELVAGLETEIVMRTDALLATREEAARGTAIDGDSLHVTADTDAASESAPLRQSPS